MKPHGTLTRYTWHGCRCEDCRGAMRDYNRDRRTGFGGHARLTPDEEAISDLLNELFPEGLTDSCPARQKLTAC